MAGFEPLNFTVKLDDSTLQQQIKKLQGELNALGSKTLDVSLSGDAHKQLAAIKSSLEQINNLKDISINIANLNSLQHLSGTITNLSIDQSMVDSIVKRIEMALANTKIKLSAADTSDVRKSVETALLDAVKGSSPSMAAEIANSLKNGISKVKLNIDAKGIADSVENALKNKTMSVKGLNVNSNDLAASIRNSLVSQHFYVTVTVKQDELIQSVNTALSKVNQIGVASQKAHGIAANAVKKHAQAWRPLSEQMKTTTQLATILGNTMGNLFSVYAVKNFLESIVEVGGELEKQKMAMGAIIGDAHDAQIIFQQLSDLSMISPFDVQDLVTYTKQLSAFGIKYDELYDTTKRLSDLAAGVGVSFGRIAYEYGQTSARGWLDGRELRMFANSGIPLLQKLSDLYTQMRGEQVTAAEVREMVTNRQVSFEDVQTVIKQMTDEGGEFYKMQEVMAESLAAKWRNLGNDWNLMMGQLAESSEGEALKGLAETLMSIVENWRVIIAMAKPMIASFAIFKAGKALAAAYNATLDSGRTHLRWFAKEHSNLKVAMVGLGQIIKANSFLLITMAVGAIKSIVDGWWEARKAHKEYEESIEGIEGRIEEQYEGASRELDVYLIKLKKAEGNQKEYARLIDSLHSKYDEYLGALDRESSAYDKVKASVDGARLAIKEKIRMQQVETAVGKVNEKYEKEIGEVRKNLVDFYKGRDSTKNIAEPLVNDLISGIKEGLEGENLMAPLKAIYGNVVEGMFIGGESPYIKRFRELFNDMQADIDRVYSNASSKGLIGKIIEPINDYYDVVSKGTDDANVKLQLEAERLTKIIELLKTGKTVVNGQELVSNGNINTKSYEAELDKVREKLSKKWLEISREIFDSSKFTFSEKAGGGSGANIISADLGAKDENDYLTYIERLSKKYKELKKSTEGRQLVNEDARSYKTDVKNLEKELKEIELLDAYAERLGFTWEEFDKSQKKKNTGNGKDPFLDQLKARVNAIKQFYEQYRSLYEEYSAFQDESTAKQSALKVVNNSGLFDPWKGIFDVPTNLDEYKKALQDVYDQLMKVADRDKRRELAETLMRMINIDIFKDDLKDKTEKAIKEALATATKELAENKEMFAFYKDMFDATGSEEYAEKWIDFLRGKISQLLDSANSDEDPMNLIGLSDDALKGMLADGNSIDAIREYLKAYKEAFDDEKQETSKAIVDAAKKVQTALKAYNAMYESYLEQRAKITDPKQLKDYDNAFALNSTNAFLKVFENNDGIVARLFSGKMGNGISSIKEAKKYIKQLMDVVNGNELPEDSPLKQLFSNEQLATMRNNTELMTQLVSLSTQLGSVWDSFGSNGIAGFIGTFGEISDKLAKNKSINEQINKLKTLGKDTSELEKQLISNEEIVTSGLAQGFLAASDILNDIVKSMNELADATGDANLSNFADSLSAFSSNLQAAGEGASSGGWIGAIVGGVSNMIEQTVSSIITAKTEAAELKQNTIDFQNALRLLDLTVKQEDFESIFGTNTMAMTSDAFTKAQKAIAAYREELNKTTGASEEYTATSIGATVFSAFAGFATLKKQTNESKTLIEAYKKGYTDLQAMAVKTTDYSGWANFWGKQDKYTSLKDLAPDLWDANGEFNVDNAEKFLETNTQITENQRKQIQNIIDLKNAYDDAIEVIDEQLSSWFGDWSSTMSDAVFDAVINGSDAWETFEDAGTEALLNVGKSMVMSKLFENYLSGFQTELENAVIADDGGQSIISAVSNIFSGLPNLMEKGEEFAQAWTDAMIEKGFDPYSSDSSLSSSIKGMTEETADILAAYLNAIRADVSIDRTALESIYGQQLPQLQATADSQLVQLTQQTEYLRMIQESNASIAEEVEALQSDFSHVIAGTKKIYTA